MFRHKHHTDMIGQKRQIAPFFVCIAVLLSFFIPLPVSAALPAGFQEYYVLGYEEHVWRAFLAINDGSDGDLLEGKICSTVSLVATTDYQIVYYDHWEDGYEADLINPIQPTTRVYGDGNPSNGGSGSDTLTTGDALNLTSNQDITGTNVITGYVSVNSGRNSDDLRYDGGDRIITSGGPVNLTHAMWPLDNSWVGGAWEVYSRQAYADAYSYRLPVGENLYDFGGGNYGIYGDFRNVYLQLGTFEDNTTVSISNDTGTVNLTLDRGQTYSSMGYVNSTPAPSITINANTVIRTNKPTQVGLITGADGNFQGRFLIVLPDQLWGADYVVPVPSGDPGQEAEIYLSNPNDFEITINAYDVETQTTFVVSPTGYFSATVPYSQKRDGAGYVPQGSAARFTSSDGVFGVVVCADTSHVNYDWGFSGVPAKYLAQDYYASWSPGNSCIPPDDPTCDSGSPAINGSPVWVTPLADSTTFYVDFNTGGLDGVVDEIFTLDVLQQRRIFDPDNDNTGMHVWATGEFAVVWGEDPLTADPSDPYLDLGVAMLPLQQRWLDPVLTLDKTADPTILPSTGDTVTFTLVAQSYNTPLVNVNISDTLPIRWTYVPSSTHVIYPDDSTGSPTPTIDGRLPGRQTLFWDISTDLGFNQSLTLTFQAQITDTGSVDASVYDGFESKDYTGGANWASPWQEWGDDDNPMTGTVRITPDSPIAGTYHLRIQGDDTVTNSYSISRSVDLSNFTTPVLHFMRQVRSLETGDYFYLDVYDRVTWTTVLTWTNGSQEFTTIGEAVDLTPYADAVSAIRFRSNDISDANALLIDQIKIREGLAISVNRGEAIGKDKHSDTLFNPTDEATVHISPLNLVKSVSSAEIGIGDTLVYTLSFTNLGDYTATHVAVRDAVPTQYVTFQSVSDGGDYSGGSGIVFLMDTLGPGDSGTVTFTVTVNEFVEDGTFIENIAYVESDQTVKAGSNVVRTTVLAPDVEFTKLGPTVAYPGDEITYTLSYENVGQASATQVTIQDTISLSATYVSGSLAINTGDGWITPADPQSTFVSPTLIITPGVTPGIIAAGETGQIRFSARLDDLPPGSLVQNWATLDRHMDNPRDTNLVITRISDLLIHKEAEPTEVLPGNTITYTLTYTNVSMTISQTKVHVREPIPDHTRFITVTESADNKVEYSWDNGVTWNSTLPITPVTHIRWHDTEVPTNTQVTLGFTVQVTTTLPPHTIIQNTASITSEETAARFHGWIPSNQVQVTTVDLWVEQNVNQHTAQAGATVSYTITYGNYGSADVSGAQIWDTIPAGTDYVPGSVWGTGAYTGRIPALLWNVGTVAAGSTHEVGYAVVLNSSLLPGTAITNTAILSSAYGLETSAPVTVTIASPVFTLTKQAGNDWTRRAKLTFTNTGQTENLVNFPVLVTLNSGRIDYDQTQNTGQDIRFVDSDGTMLAHEIEKWDEDGDSYVWVQAPQIDGSSNTDYIWVYYGNPSAPDGQNPTNVWADEYRMIYHLAEDPSLTGGVIRDSTSNDLNATNQGSTDAVGIIANAQQFESANQEYIDLGLDLAVINGVSAATLSAWIKDGGNGDIIALSIGSAGPTGDSRASIVRRGNIPRAHARSLDDNSEVYEFRTTTNPLLVNTWHYVAAVIDYANDAVTIYVDGVQQTTVPTPTFVNSTTLNTNSASSTLGSNDDGLNSFFDGLIDEARVAAAARSVNWIAAQHKSMTDAFITYGNEENISTLGKSAIIGAPLTYTITITNTGQGTGTNVVVTDTLPAGAHYISGGSFISSSDTVSWTIPTIPVDGSEQATFVVSTCQASLLNAAYQVVTSPLGPPLLTLLNPPTVEADLDYSPPSVTVGSAVYFTSTGTTNGGPIAEWAWDLGDGNTPNGPTTIHVYSNPGVYTVTLTVTDTCGYADTATETMIVHPLPTVNFDSATYSVGEGDGSATIIVTLGAASGLTVTVDYATSNGTATTLDDYTAVSGTLTFTPGNTIQTFEVIISADTKNESDETVSLALDDAGNATIGIPGNATLTILDDDDPPDVTIDDVTITEGDSGVTDAVFTVSLSAASGLTVTLDYATADGSATAPADYAAIPTTQLTFAPGETSENITVTVQGDTLDESDETFYLDLSNAANGHIADGQGVGTITDDDSPAIIQGTVFVDINGNGVQNVGEAGIPNVLITLEDTSLTATTDANGVYTFPITVTGVHTVIETDPLYTAAASTIAPMDPRYYFSTTPNEVRVNVIRGHTYQVDFGDALPNSSFASIHGIVFEDIDGDGVYDTTELGLSDVIIALDGNTAVTTNLYGSYTFSSTTSGVHIITATEPAGYFSTTPNEVHVDTRLGRAYQVNFVDAPINSNFAAIHGTVFNDINNNSLYDISETGIPNVTITLDKDVTVTTGLYGGYTLSTPVAGVHTVLETDLNNYMSTTPNMVTRSVTLNNDYQVDFGDKGTCSPDPYEEDDTVAQANQTARRFVVGPSPQAHQFCDDDTDWIIFAAKAHAVYTITTSSWGQWANTTLTIFASDDQTQTLAYNDDCEGTTDGSSCIIWEAPIAGDYYVRTNNQGGLTGRNTDYDLWIKSGDLSTIYLPVVMRNS